MKLKPGGTGGILSFKSLLISFFLSALFFCSHNLYSQEVEIYGTARSESNLPVENANVVIHSKKKSIIAYSYTDSIGEFNLKLKSLNDSLIIISIYSLIHKTVTDTVHLSSNINKYKLSFTLEDKLEQLKEVVIESDAKIKREDNKFVYSVNAFKDDTEQTVEDILKKLPGIEVLESGLIKAHGRYIDKLLIEGEDMFDKNYKMLSKNLDAKVLRNVEILEGFEDNPIFAKILSSNKVAINLVLKEEYKNIWFGNASIGAGTKERFKLASNTGLIRKKIKFFNFNNFSNLGSYAIDQVNEDYNNNEDNSIYSNIKELKITPIYETPNYHVQFFKNNEGTFNRSFINSLSFVKPINSKLKIRGTGYFLKDRESSSSQSETVFNTSNPYIIYNESRKLKSKNPLIGGSVELKYYSGEKSYLKNTLNVKNTENITYQNLLFNTSPINENLKTKQLLFLNHLNYTILVNKKLVHNYFYFGINNSKQHLNLVSPTLNSIFLQPAFTSINNNAHDKSLTIGAKSSVLLNMGKINNTLELGFEQLKENRKNTFNLHNNVKIDTLQNNIKYKQDKLFFTSNLTYEPLRNIELYGSLSIENLKLRNGYYENNYLIINPKIGFRLKNISIGNLNFQFHRDYIEPSSKTSLKNYQLTNYQSFIKGDSLLSLTRRNKYKFSYYLSNELQTQSFSISTQYIDTDGRYANNNTINKDFSFNTLKFERGGDLLITKIDFTSYFKKLKFSTNFGVLWNKTKMPVKLNSSRFSDLNLSSNSYFLTGRTYFNSKLNLNFKLSLSHTKSTLNEIISKTNWKLIAIDFKYNIHNKLNASLKNKFYLLKYGSYSFINFELNYRPEKSRFSYLLIFNNLNNENRLIMETIGEISTYNAQVKLLPRYFFLETKYRF